MADELTGDEVALLRFSVEAFREEYKELSENWRHLDTKAQGNIAISGILLAAAVAFLGRAQTVPCVAERVLSVLAIANLALTIVLAVISLRVRWVEGPPHFGATQQMVSDLLRAEDQAARSSRLADLLNEEISQWATCNDESRVAVDSKARVLSWAQLAILGGTMLIGVIAAIRVFQ